MSVRASAAVRARLGAGIVIAGVALAFSACTSAGASPSPSGEPTKSSDAAAVASPAATASFIGDCCAPPTKRPYALVTPRPTRDSGAGPTALPTSSPAADELRQEGTGFFTKTVPAKGSISVPIDFEGSTWGAVSLMTQADKQIVTFGDTTLTSQKHPLLKDGYWGFASSLDNPTNGDLVVKNPTPSPVDVVGYTMIMTRRHLTITSSNTFPTKGQAVSFDVRLTEATDADDATMTLVDSKGTQTPVDLIRVGAGHWAGTATVSALGDMDIRASTTGSRMRIATGALTVGAGGVSISPAFDEQVEDTDHDGLIDKLVVTPTMTIPSAGKYMVNAVLTDESGFVVSNSGTGEVALAAGSQPVKLEFAGDTIYKAGRWGPYAIKVTVDHETSGATTVELDTVLGHTATYDYMQFQHERVAFDPKSLAATAVDKDGDGRFDEIDFTGTVTVEEPGLYVINTSLYADNPWDYVAGADGEFQLTAGSNTFRLVFKGSDIAKSGRDGPYVEEGLLCYLDSAPMDITSSDGPRYTTPTYEASQFSG
jgi:hypothetical protein